MKQNYLWPILFGCIMCTCAFAQPAVKAQRTIGANSNDILLRTYLTRDGGMIAGGYSFSGISGEKTQNQLFQIKPLISQL